MYKIGELVTLDQRSKASNTYVYAGKLSNEQVLLTHPLSKDTCLLVPEGSINVCSPNIKDTTERCLDYVNRSRKSLDHNMKLDLECLSIYFGLKRQLSPNMKKVLANLSGVVAAAYFQNDVHAAMSYITQNKACLDDFNLMWFNNFRGLFNGSQPITSDKQTSAIYNMAGFVLSELATPSTIQPNRI